MDYKIGLPLRARSYLTVGYGASGGVPFTFRFRDEAGEEDQRGFFKVFFTNSATDLGSLLQASPFEPARAPLSKDDTRSKLAGREFYTVTVAVVEHANLRVSN